MSMAGHYFMGQGKNSYFGAIYTFTTEDNPPEAVKNILLEAEPDRSVASWGIRFAASLEGVLVVLSGISSTCARSPGRYTLCDAPCLSYNNCG